MSTPFSQRPAPPAAHRHGRRLRAHRHPAAAARHAEADARRPHPPPARRPAHAAATSGAPVAVVQPAGPLRDERRARRRAGARVGGGARQAPVPPLRARPRRARPPGPVREVLRRPAAGRRSRAGQVRMRMVGETHYADLRGPTACELLTDAEVDAIHARLGADPLRDDADPDRAWARISRSRAPLATLLMDQSVIAGVGNVYRAEALFRHGLDPQLPGRALRRHVLGRAVGRPRRPAARRVPPREDRDVAARARPAGWCDGRRPVRPRGVRLQAHRRALPGLRHAGRARPPPGPQPVLVPGVPGAGGGPHAVRKPRARSGRGSLSPPPTEHDRQVVAEPRLVDRISARYQVPSRLGRRPRSIGAMICSASSSRLNRSVKVPNSNPSCRCSSSNQPAPMPSTARPPLTTSSVVTALASSVGCR